MIKTLDTQVSCLELSGNLQESLQLATKIISNHKTSPIGYLRMGKLLRLRKEFDDAEKFYRIGLIKSDKGDKFYEVLEKQLKAVQKIKRELRDFLGNKRGEGGERKKERIKETVLIVYLGHDEYTNNPNPNPNNILSLLPLNVLNRICTCTDKSTLKSLVSTCNFGFQILLKEYLIGSFGCSTDLKSLKSSQLYSKLMTEHSVLERFNPSATFKINSESSTLLFLLYLKRNMPRVLRIKNLSIGPLRNESIELLNECISKGLSITKLEVDSRERGITRSNNCNVNIFTLKELVIHHEVGDANIIASNLESLIILSGKHHVPFPFYNCKQLKFLIYPSESNFNAFNSENIILASLKYEQSITMRPRPIQFLSLNGYGDKNALYSCSCVDLTQYSYESIKVLHLDGISLTQSSSIAEINLYESILPPLIKSSCWNGLECLRLSRIMLNNPQKDLNWILSKCPNDLKVLEIISLPLSGLTDFDSNSNGIWLIDFIFKRFPLLEHLIFGDLTFGPSTINLLLNLILKKKLKSLKVFGFINIQSIGIGYNFEQLNQTFRMTFPWSILLLNDRQYFDYSKEYNLFKSTTGYL